MLSITNFSHKIRSQSTKHPANKILRGAVSGKTVLGRQSGSSVAACSDATPLKDSAGPRTVQSVELQSERAATVSTDGQEPGVGPLLEANANRRSEEHTSELQSRGHIVCRLVLEKKKNECPSTLIYG